MWRQYFDYRQDGQLINKGRRGCASGSVAGTIAGSGYVLVIVGGRKLRAHRIVWEMHNGKIPPGYEIDHENHIRSDNRIENLRLVERRDNSLNKSRAKNNKSGVTGVYFKRDTCKWAAQIKIDGTIKYLGSFADWFDAVCARKSAENLHGFHINHGK